VSVDIITTKIFVPKHEKCHTTFKYCIPCTRRNVKEKLHTKSDVFTFKCGTDFEKVFILILNLFHGRICLHIHYFVLVTCGNLDIFVSVIQNLPQFSKYSWLTSCTQYLSASKNYSNNLFPM
jgi:hypothetical protein